MHRFRILTGVVLGLCSAGMAERMPEFSWDTVPRYMHVRKNTAFTDAELRYLATFPLITFEKTTGVKDSGSTERGTLKAAAAVKQLNPSSKILYYRNIGVHYSCYAADAALNKIDGALLTDGHGNTKLVRGRVPFYDLSNTAVQSWWLSHAKEMCSSPSIDGIFVDGSIKALEPGYLKRQIGAEKKAAVEMAYHRMMQQLPEAIGPEKLVVANILRARFEKSGLEYIEYFDGSYIEGFEHAVGGMSREDYMAKGIAAIQTAARDGKIIAFTMGMGRNKESDMGIDEARGAVKDFKSIRERFNYALATFLICAEKHSYFMASDGYGVDDGESAMWMKEIPEYAYPLGAPKGPAIKKGYLYVRHFKHASVGIDIKNERGKIIWKQVRLDP